MQTGSPCAFRLQSVVVLVPQFAQIIPVRLFPLCNVTLMVTPSHHHMSLTLLLDTLVLAGGLLNVDPVAPPTPVLGLIPFILL